MKSVPFKMLDLNDRRGLWSLVHLFFYYVILAHHLSLSSGENHQCSSTFHVWQPGQDAQKMIRQLHQRVDNMTAFSKTQISDLRAHLYNEMNRINHWTFDVDKRIMEMQASGANEELSKIKYNQGVSRVQSEIGHITRRVDHLESFIDSIQNKLRTRNRDPSNAIQQDENSFSHKQELDKDINLILKDSIGDLKAEWLLLKRDIEVLKKGEKRQQKYLQGLKDQGISLNSSLQRATSTNKNMMTTSSNMMKSQASIQEKLNTLTRKTFDTQHLVDGLNDLTQEQRAKLTTVTSLYRNLELRLNKMEDKENTKEKNETDGGKRSKSLTTMRRVEGSEESTRILDDRKEIGAIVSTDNMKDCQDVYRAGFRVSGVYHIKPDGIKYAKPVYCLIINGTGYTVLQRRLDGTINFNRRWIEYRHGFGNPYGEIWMGNEFIHYITKQKRYILRVDMWDWEGELFFAEYKKFWIEGESDHYRLNVGGYSGNSGDSLSYHNRMAFSTEDMDNDLHRRHCGAENKGGWWYNSCFLSQLNGIYHTGWYTQSHSNFADGTVWYTLKNSEFYSLQKVEMLLKPLEI